MSNKKEATSKLNTNPAVMAPSTGISSFVYMDSTKQLLDLGMASKKNVILYGLGGYGKSEFVEEYFKEKGIEPFTMTMGSGMTIDRLLGGVQLSNFIGEHATGKIEYLVENSFMNHEIVVFEELFDAPDFVLEQLKDILSSKCFRNGSQVFNIKTKFIVCNTNKTREDFAKNNSLKALMERFPLEVEVRWKDHGKMNYDHLFTTKNGSTNPMLSYICEYLHKKGKKISPRIALTAFDIMAATKDDIDSLVYIADFSDQTTIKEAVSKFKAFNDIVMLGNELNGYYNEFKKTMETASSAKECAVIAKNFKLSLDKFTKIKVDDDLATDYANKVKTYNNHYAEMGKDLQVLTAFE